MIEIRLATPHDAERISEIYAPFVRDTAVSFELEAPDAQEFLRRMSAAHDLSPWLSCIRDGELVGYAYAAPHRQRAAYQWSVEVSVYVDPRAHRSGVGRGLYSALLGALELQGLCNAYAGITLPNPASVALHESCGFEPVGVYRRVGYKFGQWHDVGWWQLRLGDEDAAPEKPRTISEARRDPRWDAALAAGARLVRG